MEFFRKNKFEIVGIIAVIECLALIWYGLYIFDIGNKIASMFIQENTPAAAISSPFVYAFDSKEILNEARDMQESSSPYWWLNSGGVMLLDNGIGRTSTPDASSYRRWKIAYSRSNPVDTRNGERPQNIFRLVTRSRWQNFRQEAYFRITKYDNHTSHNRNASNGILLMARYMDGNNLYYSGLRVDGAAVIKKKVDGDYLTLAYEKIYAQDKKYNRQSNPNFLPLNLWIGLRVEVINDTSGHVTIRLFVDQGKTGQWIKILETVDAGTFGEKILIEPGYAGIRTDFMDVEFEDYKIEII